MKKVCMIVQNPMVKGGIAAVVNGYRGSQLESDFNIIYVESYKDGGKFIKLLKAITSYFKFANVLLFNKPDLVHIHSSFGPSFYRKIPFIYMASWFNIPIINHIHGADFYEFFVNASKKKKKLIKKVYGKCDKLIALSEEWKEHLTKIVPASKITVVENYSILHEKDFQERINRPCNNKVLFLGELGQRKGCYDIPLVAKLVAEKVPNVKFVLCGSGSEIDEKKIKELSKEKKISNNIQFPGWVRGKEKNKELCEADVFFLPSYNEGMPMSILDAMGYGLAIVSSNVGGIPKIVHNGENGFCCNAGDVTSMASGIITLLMDEKKRKEAALNSINIVKKGYSLDAHIELLESIYREEIE